MAVESNSTQEERTVWIPICCSQVMRHSVFGSAEGKSVAATLRCPTCGAHILLQPQQMASIEGYGPGSRVISVLATPRPAKASAAGIGTGDGDISEETLA